MEALAPIGCHVHRSPDSWEVTLFVAATEVVGGSRDGKTCPSRFFVDVLGISRLFEKLQSVSWQAQGLGAEDEVGPHVAFEGVVHNESLWLRIPALAPRQFPPGRRAHVHQQLWEEIW